VTEPAAAATTWNAFERKYQVNTDPWNFATSAYERGRYETILSALSTTPYGCIYEPGCSVGVLTQQLSRMAERVVATDFAPSAVAQARRRCAGLRNIQFDVADVRLYRSTPSPDLIIFSEIGYYFPRFELEVLGALLAEQLAPEGELLAAHWLGHSEDHVLHGDEVHAELRATLPLEWMHGACHAGFRIDSWRKG
jgi:trans-aconitate methyltransferase